MNVLSKTKKSMEIEFEGEDDTFLNVLKTHLLKEPAVDKAYYSSEDSFSAKPVLYVEVKSGDAEGVLKSALASIKKEIADFKGQIEKLK